MSSLAAAAQESVAGVLSELLEAIVVVVVASDASDAATSARASATTVAWSGLGEESSSELGSPIIIPLSKLSVCCLGLYEY